MNSAKEDIPYRLRADTTGIWEGWRSPDGDVLRTFAVITTDANAQMASLHNRMPVILEQADWPAWLGEVVCDPAALLKPVPEGILKMWPVDKRVGNVRNDGPDLIEPEIPPVPDRTGAPMPNPV